MRILVVNNFCTAVGGKEKYLEQLCSSLRAAGHVVGTLHSVPTPAPPIEGNEIRFCIPGIDSYRNVVKTIHSLKAVTELFKPDVIHMHHDAVNLVAVMWLARHFPVVRAVHDVEVLCPSRHYVRKDTGRACGEVCGSVCFAATCLTVWNPRSWYQLFRTRIAQWIYSQFTRVDTQSQYVLTHLSESASIRRGGLVLPIFRRELNSKDVWSPIDEQSLSFVYVGRLNPWKGPQIAVLAMKNLPAECHLFIVGSGAMDKELHDLVHREGLSERVTFAGYKDSAELRDYYERAAAVIVPSILPENCPLVVLEAMMAARPIIASNVGGLPELVQDGMNGYLVTPNAPAELAAAMKRILADIPSARRMGEGGRAFVSQQKFDRQWHIETLRHEYELAIKHDV